MLFVLFLFLKTYKLKISCLLKDLCKKRSHYLSKMCDLICGGRIGFYSFTPVARLVSYDNRKCGPENFVLLNVTCYPRGLGVHMQIFLNLFFFCNMTEANSWTTSICGLFRHPHKFFSQSDCESKFTSLVRPRDSSSAKPW